MWISTIDVYSKGINAMRKTVSLLPILLLLIAFSTAGQTGKPDSAQNILNSAVDEARSSKKNVLLIFHATWCGWCKRLEAVLENPEIKPIIDNNYVVAKLDVKERGEKIQTDENPGGIDILEKFEGANSGFPYYVFLNKKGKMIANSNVMPKNQNIGYPGSKEEIAAFVKLLKKTSFRMTDRERNKISKYLKNYAPE
jgi:thioredoxin-related protein